MSERLEGRPELVTRDEDEIRIVMLWRKLGPYARLILEKQAGRLASGELIEKFRGPTHEESRESS